MNKVYIVFDCSGSMVESGRCAVLKSTFLAVRRHYPCIEVYRWNEDLQRIEKAKEIIARGSVNTTALCDFLENLEETSGILLISDGCWSRGDVEALCAATSRFDVYCCAMGQDANLAYLRKVQTLGRIPFGMSDFPTAIEHLLRK